MRGVVLALVGLTALTGCQEVDDNQFVLNCKGKGWPESSDAHKFDANVRYVVNLQRREWCFEEECDQGWSVIDSITESTIRIQDDIINRQTGEWKSIRGGNYTAGIDYEGRCQKEPFKRQF